MITRDLRCAIANAVAAAGFGRTADPGLRPTGTPGQYAASVALTLGASPRETAAILAATLTGEQRIARVEVTGPGYLTITVTPEALAAVADQITAAGPACVTSEALAGLTVPAAPPGDPLTAPTWEKARAALAARLIARLAAAAGATVAELASPERFRLTLPAHPSSLEPEPTTEVSPATSGPVSRTASPEPTSPGRLGAAPARPGQPGPSAEPAESAPDTGPVPFPGADSPPSLTARHFTNSGPESEVSRIRSDEQVPPSDAKLQWQEAAGPEGPDTMAVFAIGPAGARIGGYGGSPPREMTADIAAAVAFAGRDAVTFTLARAIPGKPLRVDPEIIARHVLGNPAYAVRYAHARAASGVRWAAASAAGPPHTFADQGETAWPTSVAGTGAPPLPIAGTGAPPLPVGGTGGPPLPFAGAGGPDTMAVFAIGPASTGIGGYGGSPPREKTVLSLLDALSWLPERVATAARRGRPDEFARYLEDLASVTVDILSSTSHPGSAGPGWAAAPGSDRLTLAKAARTGLAAGLGLLGVAAPERL